MLDYLTLHPLSSTWFAHVIIVVAVSTRVIMKRPATGVALAWLLLTVVVPFGGALAYLMIGERRIGGGRARRIEQLRTDYRMLSEAAVEDGLTEVDWSRHPAAARNMDRLGRALVGVPTVCGSDLRIYSDTQEILRTIACDVAGARKSVLMEFYIWNEGGLADDVLEAVIRAARRGVSCCLLVDALGARPWWKGKQPGKLREAGVELLPALPVGPLRTLIGRTDLRLHRKIVVIDGQVAWTGSMNMVDPRFFKQDAGVGQWVDAMARVEGAAVAPLVATMIGDWMLETGEPMADLVKRFSLRFVEPRGSADIQVIPSGPGQTSDGLLQMILALIYGAQHELVLTTPYLVPDDSLLSALRGAAGRGVVVRLILPEKVDSVITRYASRSYYDDLLQVGVEIYLYRGGLLHTKSITVDGTLSMFGTVNLDMRSFWLNYEVSMCVYQREFSKELRLLQQAYMDDSNRIDQEAWACRSFGNRFLENSLRVAAPLL